jgi:hypothetical protein
LAHGHAEVTRCAVLAQQVDKGNVSCQWSQTARLVARVMHSVVKPCETFWPQYICDANVEVVGTWAC